MSELPSISDVLSKQNYERQLTRLAEQETDVDVLEIDSRNASTPGWQKSLNHEQLVGRFGVCNRCLLVPECLQADNVSQTQPTPVRCEGPKSVLLL